MIFANINIANAKVYHIKQSLKIDIRKTSQYKKAFKEYIKQNYKLAFKLFKKLLNKDSANEYINFYYGVSAYQLGYYEVAFGAFDRVLITNKQNYRARLELARTLFAMRSYKESKKEFQKVLLGPIPQSVRENINKFIKVMDRKKSGYIFNKIAIIGFGWGDNIKNTPDTYTINKQKIEKNKKSDASLKIVFVGNLIVPLRSYNHLTSESTIILFAKKQNKIKTNDIFATSVNTGIGYLSSYIKHLTSITYDYILIDGKNNSQIFGVKYIIKARILKTDILSFGLNYKIKKMVATIDKDKNNKSNNVYIRYIKSINLTNSLFVDFSYIREKKVQGSRVDISKKIIMTQIAYKIDIANYYHIKTSYRWTQSIFDDMYGFDDKPLEQKRKDINKNIGLRLSKEFDKSIVSMQYNNNINDTNHDAYYYQGQNIQLDWTILF